MSDNSKRKSFIAFMATLIALLPAGFGTVLLLTPPLETEDVEKEKDDEEDEHKKNTNKQELSSILPPNQRNLGTITTNGASLPSETQIQTELKQKGIDISEVEIQNISNTQATINAQKNSTKYKGEVTVNYILDTKQDLSTVITTTDLGIIETNGQQLTDEMIKSKLPENIQTQSKTSIVINEEINKIMEEWDDEDSKLLDFMMIIKMIKDKLPDDIQNEVNITINSNTQATINAQKNSTKYKGEVTVNYILDTRQTLDSVITKNLGIIETNDQQLTVEMIKDKLPDDIQNEVNITINSNTQATINAQKNSSKYKDTVEVIFRVW